VLHASQLVGHAARLLYYKFWWTQELSCLKDNAITSNKVWKEAGRPRTGPVADKRNSDKRKYKNMLSRERRAEKQCYNNDLHDALISKSGVSFWKCWKSKFEKKTINLVRLLMVWPTIRDVCSTFSQNMH